MRCLAQNLDFPQLPLEVLEQMNEFTAYQHAADDRTHGPLLDRDRTQQPGSARWVVSFHGVGLSQEKHLERRGSHVSEVGPGRSMAVVRARDLAVPDDAD